MLGPGMAAPCTLIDPFSLPPHPYPYPYPYPYPSSQLSEASHQLEQRLADQATTHAHQLEALGSTLSVHRAASKRYKAHAEQAFNQVGQAIKVSTL